ncbi:MAG: hypothetical protein E7C49_02500 [Clostridium sp.]|nr:hypothetical protein [Clostridium sp.]
MGQKSYKNLGKFLLSFSIIASLILVFVSFRGGNFIGNLTSGSISRAVPFSLTCILLILGGISMKRKYPEYYKYQVVSGVLLLATAWMFDFIPRIMYLV